PAAPTVSSPVGTPRRALVTVGDVQTLDREEWLARAAAHEARLAPFLDAHLERRTARVKHPVHDFLFVYYSHKPGALRRWHPGFGTALVGAEAYEGLKGYEVADGVATV